MWATNEWVDLPSCRIGTIQLKQTDSVSGLLHEFGHLVGGFFGISRISKLDAARCENRLQSRHDAAKLYEDENLLASRDAR